jgi:hypothetical protein
LTNNPLEPEGLVKFLSTLDCPSLTELHLSTCKLLPPSAEAISDFLKSPRSRSLEYLELNGNNLGAEGVRKIVDAVEESHFGILQVGVLSNEEWPRSNVNDDDDPELGPEGFDSEQEGKLLRHLVHERLPDLIFRNRYVTRRVRRAALRTIGPARILLHARPPSDEDTASRIMEEVSAVSLTCSASPTSRPFPILELPPEVLNLIIRHCSQDPHAMTESQYARLRSQAENRDELTKLVRLRTERLKGIFSHDEQVRKEREIRDEWLKRGKWDKWERQ